MYDRAGKKDYPLHQQHQRQGRMKPPRWTLDDPKLVELIGQARRDQLADEIELLEGAGAEFDMERVRHGKLSPVFFGSALTNFGVEPFLEEFLRMTTPPLSRKAGDQVVDAFDDDFSGFVFKIQANMNKAHRDRIAFVRVCSGRFDADKEVLPGTAEPQGEALPSPADDGGRSGNHRRSLRRRHHRRVRPRACSPSATRCAPRASRSNLTPSPPSHRSTFRRVRPEDTMKRKQFIKGTEQIAQEGGIQIFQDPLRRYGGGHRGRAWARCNLTCLNTA